LNPANCNKKPHAFPVLIYLFNILKINVIILYLSVSLTLTIFIMNKGTVTNFDAGRGFGFIMDSASGKEYFIDSSGLSETIGENDTVTFELKQGKKGLSAVNVKLA
jgi:cold shock protein